MRLHCREHGYMDEKTGPMAECPYCEIDRLNSNDRLMHKTNIDLSLRIVELESELKDSKNISSAAIGHHGSLMEVATGKSTEAGIPVTEQN